MIERLPSTEDVLDRPPGRWDVEGPSPEPAALEREVPRARRVGLWIGRGIRIGLALLLVAIVWLLFTAPLSKSLEPIAPPRVMLRAADGQPIARNGAIVDRPVKAQALPAHVRQAFLAIEDRRFYSHWGIDPRGLARALYTNMRGGGMHGGSTITQQLAKFTFLNSDQTLTRKGRELLIAFWLEAWLTKDEILERYLSNAYFGDNVYGLRAASLHYFFRQPERLTLPQAAMLAGLLKAPSRLAPSRNLKGAQARSRLVLGAMADAGFITLAKARAAKAATVDLRVKSQLPTGTYFADWAMPQARSISEDAYGDASVTTTLDARLQRLARQVVGRAGLGKAQVALVAMRPSGEVVAMIGGRDYARSPFNRATQARRQPGSTFKLFVYLAALRAGMSPDDRIEDTPLTIGSYTPRNNAGRYRGSITLREAFAQSSNVAAVRLYQRLGSEAVIDAARDLGIRSALKADPTLALGSSGVTLLELTAAYAGIAADRPPVIPRALPQAEAGFFERLWAARQSLGSEREMLLDMLQATVDRGTARGAKLAIDAYGKTGTSQDNRDALFIGFAGDLVVGVWIGNDDNTPLAGISGGGLPVRIWRDFMAGAIPGARPAPKPRTPAVVPDESVDVPSFDLPFGNDTQIRIDGDSGVRFETRAGGLDLDVRLDEDGVSLAPPERRQQDREAPARDTPPPEPDDVPYRRQE